MKKQQKERMRRMMRVFLPLIILGVILLVSGQVDRVSIKPDVELIYAKATVTQITEDQSSGVEFAGSQKVEARITSGEYKGMTCELSNPNTFQRGAMCTQGTKIIALLQTDDSGNLTGSVYNYDRTGMVYLLIGLFALCLILIGGKKGAASLYALIFTFVCIICMYIPLLYVGMNGTLAAILTAVVILVASIYILNGRSVKTGCAILGTSAGVAMSGLLAMLIGAASHLTGYHMSDAESMIYIANNTRLDVANILYAGVLISSLGAVMDVSVSLVAAMKEIKEKNPSLSTKELFTSGMRVGHDMMGTMSNTLILAYTGSATGVLLSAYSYEMSYLQMMGNNSIVIEILCGLCGTVGVILTVPIQASITALMLSSKRFMSKA